MSHGENLISFLSYRHSRRCWHGLRRGTGSRWPTCPRPGPRASPPCTPGTPGGWSQTRCHGWLTWVQMFSYLVANRFQCTDRQLRILRRLLLLPWPAPGLPVLLVLQLQEPLLLRELRRLFLSKLRIRIDVIIWQLWYIEKVTSHSLSNKYYFCPSWNLTLIIKNSPWTRRI